MSCKKLGADIPKHIESGSETQMSVIGTILVSSDSSSHISTTTLVVQWITNSEAQKDFTYFIKYLTAKKKKIYNCHKVPKWFSLYGTTAMREPDETK